MPPRKPSRQEKPRQVRKSLTVDADKLERARKLLGTSSDAETLRQALDHLLTHQQMHRGEEE
jgi:uncharacterized damage-inducible protein DinB